MTLKIIRSFLMIGLLLSGGQAVARDLKIAFSHYMPPYVFEDNTGIVVDIVRTAMESAGHKVTPVYVPFGRVASMLDSQQVDGAAVVQESSGVKAHYSDVFMEYHNSAFALKSRKLKINGVGDLQGKSVIGFQNASKYLGDDFSRMAAGNSKYKEMAQQDSQTQMLLLGRADVAVMDESIFRFYREKLISEGKAKRSQEYDSFGIFPPTPYKTAFKDAKLRDEFNAGIAAMKKDGRYDAIYRKYVEQYFAIKK